ncbi:MAG: DUF4358 domain-containing protein [Peptostreptococcaceae bacterium]
MKTKKFLKMLIVPFMALTIAGCSNSDKENLSLNMDELKETISTEEYLDIQPLATLDLGKGEGIDYPFVELQDVKGNIQEGFALTAMMNVHFQEVVVIKTDDVEKVTAALEAHLEEAKKSTYADGYGGEHNTTAIANGVVGSKGNYVYYIAAKNVDKIKETIESSIK